jgi:hypothetical protein
VNQYKVVASDPATSILAIEDGFGKCHLGRALTAAPPPGTTLLGDAPAVGLRLLHAPEAVVPLVMVLLDCDPRAAIKLAGGLGDGLGP